MLYRPPTMQLVCPRCGLRFRLERTDTTVSLNYGVQECGERCVAGTDSPAAYPEPEGTLWQLLAPPTRIGVVPPGLP